MQMNYKKKAIEFKGNNWFFSMRSSNNMMAIKSNNITIAKLTN